MGSAAILWGATGTLQGIVSGEASSLSVAWVRLVIGALGFAPLLFLRPRVAWSSGHAAAALCVIAYQAFFFAAARGSVAAATMVMTFTACILTSLFDLFAGGRIPPRALLLIGGALVGVSLLLAPAWENVAFVTMALAAGAGVSYASYARILQKLGQKSDPTANVARVFVLAGALVLPAGVWLDAAWVVRPVGVFVALTLGLATVVGAYALFALGVPRMRLSIVGALSLLEPVVAAVLASAILDQVLAGVQWLGIVLAWVSLATLVATTRS